MRRIAVVLVLLAAATVAASAPAAARTTTTTVSKTGLPTGIHVVRVSCPEPSPPVLGTTSTAFSHVFGSEFPPLGHGSLRVESAASTNKIAGLMISSPAALGNVTRLSVWLLSEISRIYAHVFPNGSDWVLSRDSQVFTGGWSNHDLLALTGWTWTDGVTTEGPGTLADFVAAHPPSSSGFKVELLAGNCAVISPNPSYFDNLQIGVSNNTKKYDFESPAGGLTMTANHSTIPAVNSVKLSTVFKDGGLAMGGRTVELWAKKQGATHFVRIKVLSTAFAPNAGHASATLKPTKTTTYQWRHALDASIQATRSPTKIVHVTH